MHCGNILMDNRKKERRFAKPFEQAFGVKMHPFFDYVMGFDVVAFDKYLEVPDGTSTKEFIAEKYGDDAVTLVENLILQ